MNNAIAYCRSLGLDPYEIVVGFDRDRWGSQIRIEAPRWKWYQNAILDTVLIVS